MTRDEAKAILELPTEQAIDKIISLAEKAEKYDRIYAGVNSNTPSGMIPTYLKPQGKKRKRKPGRKNGHKGVSRPKPNIIHHYKEHVLGNCPNCNNKLGKPNKNYIRYTEDIPPVEPEVTEHRVNGYWCSACKKIVYAKVSDALPNSVLGLRLVIFTAWLHYLIGMSVNNIVNMLAVFANFQVSAGGLTQAWKNLAITLEPLYDNIGQIVSKTAVLHVDETGWRISGITHWLWCFCTDRFCYYIIDRSRGSPVIKSVLGKIFEGILICDFWGAYNKIKTLATQRCFYHMFTELDKVDKKNKSGTWKLFRKKFTRLLKDAVRLGSQKQELIPGIYYRRKQRLYDRLDQLIEIPHNEDKDIKRLIKRLKRHRTEFLTFLEYEGVSPYNNHAEQQMRKPVITRKISQQNRSEQGAKTHAILMSLFRSAELQKLNPVEWVLLNTKAAIKANQPNDTAFDLTA